MARFITLLFVGLYPVLPAYFNVAGIESAEFLGIAYSGMYLIIKIVRTGKLAYDRNTLKYTLLVLLLLGVPLLVQRDFSRLIRNLFDYGLIAICLIDYFDNRKKIEEAYNVLLIACVITCFIGFFEFITHSNIFAILENSTLSGVGPELQFRGMFSRVETSFGHSISYGIYLGINALLASYLSITTRQRKYTIGFLVIVICLMLTIARGPILMYAVCQIILLWQLGKKVFVKTTTKIIALLAIITVIAALAFPNVLSILKTIGLMVASLFSENAIEAVGGFENSNPFLYRLGLLSVIPPLLKGHWLIGVGRSTSISFSLLGHIHTSIDNGWLSILLRYGIIGICGYLLIIFAPLFLLKKKRFQGIKIRKLYVILSLFYAMNLASVAMMSEYRIWTILYIFVLCIRRMGINKFEE